MNNLQIFNNQEFGQVRIVEIGGKPYAVGIDIAKALGYKNPNDAIVRHCKGYVKHAVPTKGGTQQMNVIPEGDIYRLAANSELPGAERFERWIFDEVLPTIRKHGAYVTDEVMDQILNNPDFGIKLLTELKAEREEKKRLQAKIEQDKPKVLFAEALEISESSILVGELAKILRQNGIDIGQNRLFAKLRKEGYLGNRGEYYNIPTQKSMDLGLFEIKTRTINNPDGSVRVTKTSKVTTKGQIYFINKFKNNQIAI